MIGWGKGGVTAALLGGAVLMALLCVGWVRATLPAWAGESEDAAAIELDARWRSFAADLASASGCSVRYESPLGDPQARGSSQARRPGDHGSIGVLRIGAVEGPAVLVMPDGFLMCGEPSRAYEHSGLREPRRLAQELVSAAAFPGGAPAGDAAGISTAGDAGRVVAGAAADLGTLLDTRAVLLPVSVMADDFAGVSKEQIARVGSPRRNFPVRWEEAASKVPALAGPYPASHPGVRALTAWLNDRPDCAGLVVVRSAEAPTAATGSKSFVAGTLEGFCSEVLGMGVATCSADQCQGEIERSLAACGQLSLSDAKWTRLGATNWSLEVTLNRTGSSLGDGGTVLLSAANVAGEVRLTAAAATLEGGADGPMELLVLRKQGVLLDHVRAGEERRIRLFFAALPEGIPLASGGRSSGGSPASAPEVLEIELTATARQVQRAVIRATSPS